MVLIDAFLPLSSRSKLISAAGANRITVVMPGPCDVAAENYRRGHRDSRAFFSVTVAERDSIVVSYSRSPGEHRSARPLSMICDSLSASFRYLTAEIIFAKF